ncbi:pyridoxal-phosphate-dependent aminotransferase family protein [Aliivibrio salmonicida]|uniref:pyridoxal-phosphate-dependent aminotransferase family protein n=1 Tax=Aliivibrio salmonicida TaxID=40269 RepID=UPI003D14494C
MKKDLLFTPGPVNLATNVRIAVGKKDICHREVEFDRLLDSIENKLLQVFNVNKDNYRAVVITGSGTAANESILSSVVGDKHILILSNGEFGERLNNISKIHNKNTHHLSFSWGHSFDLKTIEAYLVEHHIDVVAMVHHETCSGMLNSLDDIGALTKKYDATFVVDCVSSAGAEVIDMEKCNIAFISSSSSKAIGSYSGLSFVIGKTAEFEKLKDLPAKTMYLNLYTFYSFICKYSQTPNTPAVHLFYALEQALSNIIDKGVDSYYADLKNKANILRKGIIDLGLKFLIEQKNMCSMLTTVCVPLNVNVSVLRKELRDKSIIIYEGKGCFQGKVFQVGNIGELSLHDIEYFLSCLKEILNDFLLVGDNKLSVVENIYINDERVVEEKMVRMVL